MLDTTLSAIRRHTPGPIFNFFNRPYHWTLAFVAACRYGFPSRKIKVIGVTGTKGKSSTVELINAILEEAGYKTALSNTIRFKIDTISSENLFKMSMPGRFTLQKLLHKAVQHKCDYFIMEMTSQGAILFRNRFVEMDVFVFTNLSPEHIEAHGSYENYKKAKLSIAKNFRNSGKLNKIIIVNGDDPESASFLECDADKKISYSLKDAEPYEVKKEGIEFTYDGKKAISPLSGLFNLYNILAAATTAQSQGVSSDIIIQALKKFGGIPGRVQKIISPKGKQDFEVIVDYAHTPDSQEKLYQVFKSSRTICILGGTGGGRDTWRRKEMGRIADEYCDEIILTDEDPYDDDPRKIVDDVASGISSQTPTVIMDRREAIREGLKRAKTGDVVLITGKGTDPYIMGPKNSKTPWSDARVAEEELGKLKNSHQSNLK